LTVALALATTHLLSERPYKKAWTHPAAVQEIISRRNTQFDPLVVEAFIAEQDAFKDLSTQLKD
jgi:response regulator RpfG family c-di-GMP phosphodiesterase